MTDAMINRIVTEDRTAARRELRDRFAMAALSAFCSKWHNLDSKVTELVAEAAYAYADAMLKERDKA